MNVKRVYLYFIVTIIMAVSSNQSWAMGNPWYAWGPYADITRADTVQGPCPISLPGMYLDGVWRNFNMQVISYVTAEDSILVDTTERICLGAAGLVSMWPMIIIRNLDADPDVYFIPDWAIDWGLHWRQEGDRYIMENRNRQHSHRVYPGAHVERFHFHENTTYSLCLPEGVNLRVYYTLLPIYCMMEDQSASHGIEEIYCIIDMWEGPPWEYEDPGEFLGRQTAGIDSVDVFIPGFQTPPAYQIKFVKYIMPNGSSGINWLPAPGDSVGVVMKHVLDVTGIFGYVIHHISTWQGICMNYPTQAQIPISIPESDTCFDIRVGQEYQNKYTTHIVNCEVPLSIYTHDQDYYRRAYGSYVRSEKNYSHRMYHIVKNTPTRYDTLWIVAKDYAAHCVISPRSIPKEQYRMNMRTDAAGRDIWTISVPRDDDGYYNFGSNTGDYMADAWEEDYISSGGNIYDFLPFANWSKDAPYLPTDHPSADQDSVLAGRFFLGSQLYGDKLTAWQEYRGFWVCGNKDNLFDGKHQILDPVKKTVFCHITPTINDTIKELFPGFISLIDNSKLEVFFTDSLEEFDPNNWDDRDTRTKRKVTLNCTGASRFYYGYPELTTSPFIENQNAITFWSRDGMQALHDNGDYYGVTRTSAWVDAEAGGTQDTITCPDLVKQCIINTDRIWNLLDSLDYYDSNPDSLISSYNWKIRYVIAHEFGHTIGMQYLNFYTIMANSTRLELTSEGWRLKTDPISYADSSYGQTAVRKPYFLEAR